MLVSKLVVTLQQSLLQRNEQIVCLKILADKNSIVMHEKQTYTLPQYGDNAKRVELASQATTVATFDHLIECPASVLLESSQYNGVSVYFSVARLKC